LIFGAQLPEQVALPAWLNRPVAGEGRLRLFSAHIQQSCFRLFRRVTALLTEQVHDLADQEGLGAQNAQAPMPFLAEEAEPPPHDCEEVVAERLPKTLAFGQEDIWLSKMNVR